MSSLDECDCTYGPKAAAERQRQRAAAAAKQQQTATAAAAEQQAAAEIERLTAELAQVKENSFALCVEKNNRIAKLEDERDAAFECGFRKGHECSYHDVDCCIEEALQEVHDE